MRAQWEENHVNKTCTVCVFVYCKLCESAQNLVAYQFSIWFNRIITTIIILFIPIILSFCHPTEAITSFANELNAHHVVCRVEHKPTGASEQKDAHHGRRSIARGQALCSQVFHFRTGNILCYAQGNHKRIVRAKKETFEL